MSNTAYISETQVASSVPFDNSTVHGFFGSDVQTALEELRDRTVFISQSTATTASGTLTLTVNSNTLQFLTGSAAGYSVVLPDATTIPVCSQYQLVNTTSQAITIKDGSGATLFSLSQNSIAYCYLQTAGSVAGTWVYWQVLASSTASGVINYNVVSSTAFNTSATTDTLITGFTVTPQAGTYAIWYNAEILYTTTPITHYWSIYKGGAQVADSLRSQDTAHSNQNMVDSTMTIAQVNGSQAIDVRVRCGTSGNITVNQRSLLLIRLGA